MRWPNEQPNMVTSGTGEVSDRVTWSVFEVKSWSVLTQYICVRLNFEVALGRQGYSSFVSSIMNGAIDIPRCILGCLYLDKTQNDRGHSGWNS